VCKDIHVYLDQIVCVVYLFLLLVFVVNHCITVFNYKTRIKLVVHMIELPKGTAESDRNTRQWLFVLCVYVHYSCMLVCSARTHASACT
jgi:hypothetical protein